MLVITVDPKQERVEITVGEHTVVLFVKEKVKMGIIAPKEVSIQRVKIEQAE
jgi:sRNA-binding carbon storage regulator CsrA